MQPFTQLPPDQFKQALDSGEYFLLDVRTEGEVVTYGEIAGTQARYDVYQPDFTDKVLKLPKNDKYLLYCWHGNRTQAARNWMQEQGFTGVWDLAGGIDAWKY